MAGGPQRFWSRQPIVIRVLVLAVVGIGVIQGLALVVGGDEDDFRGPRSSAHTTGPGGLAAYASLLERFGHPVSRSAERIDRLDPEPGSTVVVLDPDTLLRDEAERLREIAAEGSTVVVGGARIGGLGGLVDEPPRGSPGGPRLARAVGTGLSSPAPQRVVSGREGTWSELGETERELAGVGGTLLVSAPIGEGRALLLADASPLQNRLLGKADNAQLGLRLAGDDSPVTLVESVHGFGAGRGLAALPGSWAVALIGLMLAGLTLIAARARRLGPPEEPVHEAAPARVAYVDALGLALTRVGESSLAVESLRGVAASRLSRRNRVGPDSDPAWVERAAVAAGLSPEDARALSGTEEDEEGLMRTARALADLTAREEGR